ncbi:MAG: hypothetical protein U1F60_05045 [Planctomycetota bacterium]
MNHKAATKEVLQGASLAQIAAEFRENLLRDFGFRDEETTADTFANEVASFMRGFARHLGDRHAGDARIGYALQQWILKSDHYEAWDALLSGFDVDGRDVLIRRGRVMFPGPMTAHWDDR